VLEHLVEHLKSNVPEFQFMIQQDLETAFSTPLYSASAVDRDRVG